MNLLRTSARMKPGRHSALATSPFDLDTIDEIIPRLWRDPEGVSHL